ncbi:UNVERIFIED_CONTAM: hypothetical protein Slati_3082200 [Sesamum latifolium]|uniref:Uncharacterized protein n=1 Tax=Sesamum latifolium TaxID=2727402 RepID=A0AAW2UUJ7_9LAMI
MEHSKRGLLPMRHGIKLSKKQSPKTDEELKRMSPPSPFSPVYQAQCRLRFERKRQISGMRWGGALERGQEHS